MKDFMGQEVQVGDYIFYSTTGRYAESRICKITRFTAKSMFVVPIKVNRPSYNTKDECVVRNDFVKIDYENSPMAE